MIKIAQFGEGNFLRAFADIYFDTLNKQGGQYSVNIIKPIKHGSLDSFKEQGNRYNVILRGCENGQSVEDVYEVSSVDSVFSPYENPEMFYSLATDPELKLIISNTTEAGICYCDEDRFDNFDSMTFPARLTKFLYERFKAGLEGVYLLPVELIEDNADELYRCVDGYIKLWGLGDDFKNYNDTQNFYCNTLVDRIVSGYPRDEQTKAHLTELIGKEDKLMSVGEPFGLWAVEKKGDIQSYIPEGKYNIDVVLTDNIAYYKKRKVRVLNGCHTNLVSAGMMLGKQTVYDCMSDEKLLGFFNRSLEEIIPFVSSDIEMTKEFANAVVERFLNPYLNHQLTSIALNSVSKWKARNLPTFKDYYKANGKIPYNLTVGFSYLVALYTARYAELADDARYIEFFANGGTVVEFMSDVSIWDEDLTAYEGFADAVAANVSRILEGEVII